MDFIFMKGSEMLEYDPGVYWNSRF